MKCNVSWEVNGYLKHRSNDVYRYCLKIHILTHMISLLTMYVFPWISLTVTSLPFCLIWHTGHPNRTLSAMVDTMYCILYTLGIFYHNCNQIINLNTGTTNTIKKLAHYVSINWFVSPYRGTLWVELPQDWYVYCN